MSVLISTMSRRNRVGPDTEEAEKAAQQFQSITTEEERHKVLHTIRQLPSPMATKMQLKKKLMEGPVTESYGVKQMKFENKKRMQSVKNAWHNFKYTMELWGSSMRTIEGHHGTGVVSYFVFLRYLLLVNFCMFLLSMFIWVPEAIHDESAYTSGSTAATCTPLYDVNVSSNAFELILDFFQGSGWMEKTMMFYGYYSGNGLENTSYKLSLAYILVCISCLVVSLILMGKYLVSDFRETILNAGDGLTEFCNKVFGTWDYALTDNTSASIKHKSVRFELLSDMNEQIFVKEREQRLRDGSLRCKLYTIRIIINIFIVLVLGASGYLIYYVTDYSTGYVSRNADVSGTTEVLLKLLVQFLPAITISALNGMLPVIFQKVVVGEEYTNAFVVKITLVRTVFLRLASLTVLMVTLYSAVTCSTRSVCMSTSSPCSVITCWETYVGQQLYKLIIADFLAVIIKTLLVELPRRLCYEKCSCGIFKKIGPPEFDIPACVLDLVYSQCLYWLALTFAPLAPTFAVLKVVVTFYMKRLSVLKACPPAEQPSRASRTNTFFMVILLIAFFICSVPVGYVFYDMEPSHGCGPFRTYGYMYHAITQTVEGWPSGGQGFYNLIVSPAVTGPLIIFLILLIYYCSVLASAHKSVADIYREQLVMEGRDKQYLMVKVMELGGDSTPAPKPRRAQPAGLKNINETAPAPRKVASTNSFRSNDRPPSYQTNNQQMSTGLSSPHAMPVDDGW
ncbi:transmembrane channel-like protein 7 isoform X2 [Littorina saxatilis]